MRLQSCVSLAEIAKIYGKEWAEKSVIPKISELSSNPDFKLRETAVFYASVL